MKGHSARNMISIHLIRIKMVLYKLVGHAFHSISASCHIVLCAYRQGNQQPDTLKPPHLGAANDHNFLCAVILSHTRASTDRPKMDNFRTRTLTIAATFVCLVNLNFVAVDADNVKCSYNSLISNFNRKPHEDGQGLYYECDELTGYYIEKMCAIGETFDVKKLVSAEWRISGIELTFMNAILELRQGQ